MSTLGYSILHIDFSDEEDEVELNPVLIEMTRSHLEIAWMILREFNCMAKPEKPAEGDELNDPSEEDNYVLQVLVRTLAKTEAKVECLIPHIRFHELEVSIAGVIGTFHLHFSGKVSTFKRKKK